MAKAKAPAGLEDLTVTELPEVGDVLATAEAPAPEVPKAAPEFDPQNPLPFFQANDPKVTGCYPLAGGWALIYG